MKSSHKDIPCANYPHVSAHITWRASARGPITLRGYLIDSDSGVRKGYSKELKRTAQDPEEIPSKIQILYNALCVEVAQHERRAAKKVTNSEGEKSDFALALDELELSEEVINSEWSPETRRGWIVYVRRNIIPKLEAVGSQNWTAQDSEDLESTLLKEILSSKKSIGYEDVAKATLQHNLSAFLQIYRSMRIRYPYLPDIHLSGMKNIRVSRPEQLKSLSNKVRRRIAKLVEALIETNPRLAMAAIMMLDCGLRTAEAAAVWKDVIVVHDTVTYVLVCYQVKGGSRTKVLKTSNAYRLVPLTYWGEVMIARCIDRLSQNSYGGANECCDVRTLSKTIREYLIAAGLTKEYLFNAAQIMRERPDIDGNGFRVHDVVAYILRRDWASRARNICGLPSIIIDALLGHQVKIPQKMRADLRHKEKLAEISVKLERYILDPEYSRHPGITPISLTHSTDIDLTPFDVIRLKNTSDELLDLKVDLEAILNAESLNIIAPKDSQYKSIHRYIQTHCQRDRDPIIGSSFMGEEGESEKTAEKERGKPTME